ncbi:hypothetical protein EDC01DRAFT_633848 [Geopyxis carbonaria]|nr:hypothetical protein EDC01DRAFT_633848 [Geopyxis carbonaria]
MDWESTALTNMESKFNAMIRKFMDKKTGGSKTNNGNKKCYECGKLGHIKKDCYSAKNRKNNDNRKKDNRRSKFNSMGAMVEDICTGSEDNGDFVEVESSSEN